MKKQLKRFGSILFLSGAMLFFGCQTEELTVSDTRVESGIVHRHIDFETFSKQFPKPAEKLLEQNEKTSNKMQRGGVYDPLNDFTILTDYIFMAVRDGETYFTFGISREEQTFAGLENLLLVPDGQGGFSPLLTQYNITESEKNQIAEGVEIQDLENKMAVEPLDGVDFGGVNIPRGDDGCWTMTVSYCSADLHMGGLYDNGEDCDGHTEIVVSFGCSNEGGNGASGPAGPGTYPGTSTPGNGTGGGGSTAPGTGNPSPGNPLDGNQDPGTGGPNPGTGGGKKPIITGPVYIPHATNTLFTFEFYLSSAQRSWLNQHSVQRQLVYGFVAANHYNQLSLDFAYPAVDALMEGGEVDFTYRIIKDDSFKNNPCLNSVYAQLGNAGTFQNYLKNFDGSFSVANLKLSASSSLDDTTNAETSSPENYLITITFNTNKLNRPALSIARTFIHELIHAEIYRKLLSVAGSPSISLTQEQIIQLKNNYPGLYDYYMRFKWNIPSGQAPTNAQHEAMAQHYRSIIKQALREYDNNSQSDETYDALAWVGLEDTVAWNNLSQSQRNNITTTIDNFENSNSNCN